MNPEQKETVGFSTRPYKISIKRKIADDYTLTLDLVMDGRDMVDHSQITAIIELVKILKPLYRTSPDIMTNDDTREIELEY